MPIQEVSETLDTDDPREAVRQFLAKHPAARLVQLGGQFVRGVCACGTVVLEADAGYRYDTDREAYVCPACHQKEKP